MRQPQPTSPDGIADRLIEMIGDRAAGHPVRVAVDGPPFAGTATPIRLLLDRLPATGRVAVHIDTRYFLRPASLRLERGRTDPDAFYEDGLDREALRREVLDPAGPGGSFRVLPTLRDPESDRATRAPYEELPSYAVLLVEGSFLLGHGLPFDLTVHMRLSRGALRRRAPEDEDWTLPAFERYEAEVRPVRVADLVVFADDPRRPAILA